MKIINITYIFGLIAVFARSYSLPPNQSLLNSTLVFRPYTFEVSILSYTFFALNILLITYLIIKIFIKLKTKDKLSKIGISFYFFTIIKTLFFTFAYLKTDRSFQIVGIIYSLILPAPLIFGGLDDFKLSKLGFMKTLDNIFTIIIIASFYAYLIPNQYTKNIFVDRMNFYFPSPNFAAWFFSISGLFYFNKILFDKNSTFKIVSLFLYLVSILLIISTGGRVAFVLTIFSSLLLIFKRFTFNFNKVTSIFSFIFASTIISAILFPNFSLDQFRVTNFSFFSGRDEIINKMINDFLENPFIGTGAYENTESSILLVLSVGGLMLLLPLTLLIINSLGKIIRNFLKSNSDFFIENYDLSFISIVFIYFLLLSITEGFLVLDRFSFNSIIIIYCLNRYISFLAEKNINQSGLNIK